MNLLTRASLLLILAWYFSLQALHLIPEPILLLRQTGAAKPQAQVRQQPGGRVGGCQPIALPRVRDFRGISADAFDGRGNYTLGLQEQLIFPEIQYDKIDKVRGMEVSIVTTAENDDHARQLLSKFGMPFRKGN